MEYRSLIVYNFNLSLHCMSVTCNNSIANDMENSAMTLSFIYVMLVVTSFILGEITHSSLFTRVSVLYSESNYLQILLITLLPGPGFPWYSLKTPLDR